MGAHGTFEEALKGVTDFAVASAGADRAARRKEKKKQDSGHKHRSDKHKSSSKKREDDKHKKRKKEKKEKGERRKHKSKKDDTISETSSSDDDSDSDTVLRPAALLERGRAAVRILRNVLWKQPELKKDLRELCWRIDHGEAVDITGLADQVLKDILTELLSNLPLKKTSKGYVLAPQASPILTLLGPIFEEEPAAPAEPPKKAPEPQRIETAGTSATSAGQGTQVKQEVDGQGIGPACTSGNGQIKLEEVEKSGLQAEEPAPAAPRVAGPAMPPPEILAMAAEAAEAYLAELEDDELVGPAPPELLAEAESAGDDARSAEVARVLGVLRAAASAAGSPEPDAYDVLGVEQKAAAGEVKKKYWRLSLLIHPDKCSHPRAQEAFQAVRKAQEELADAGKRAVVDARREDAELRRMAGQVAEQQERDRQWRVARGQASAEDLEGPIRAGPQDRESWMTELPAEMRPSTDPLKQRNVTMFSQRGIEVGADLSAWTDTPASKLARLTAAAQQHPALQAGPSAEEAARTARMAAAVDGHGAAARQLTLMQQHEEALKAAKKAARKKRKAEGLEAKKEEWEGEHPWRPFDREKDFLGSGKKTAAGTQGAIVGLGNLSSRFGGDQRSFL